MKRFHEGRRVFADAVRKVGRWVDLWAPARSHRRFGDLAVVLFLVVQCLDGAFTYLGVSAWGLQAEGNPLVSSTVNAMGLGTGLAAIKLLASALGITLHLHGFHLFVALLTAFYLAAAILPWTFLLTGF